MEKTADAAEKAADKTSEAVDQMKKATEKPIENETLQKAAAANSKDDFQYVFEKAFERLVIDRMEGNEEIFTRLMSDSEFRKAAMNNLLGKVYRALMNPSLDPPQKSNRAHAGG